MGKDADKVNLVYAGYEFPCGGFLKRTCFNTAIDPLCCSLGASHWAGSDIIEQDGQSIHGHGCIVLTLFYPVKDDLLFGSLCLHVFKHLSLKKMSCWGIAYSFRQLAVPFPIGT